jgi:hypothetical protein
MRSLFYGLLLIAGAESAALACTCISPGTPEETRPIARQAVQRAAAIVEVDVLSEYRDGGLGEHVRVRRLLWGEAPAEFRIQRREFASSASCDLLLTRGERRLLILYPVRRGRFAIQSLCDDFLLNEPGHLAVTLEEARRRGAPIPDGERG